MPPLPATTSSMRMSESPSLIEPLVLPRAQYVPARSVLELFVPPTHQDPLIDRSHMPVEGAMKSHVKSVRASAIGSGWTVVAVGVSSNVLPLPLLTEAGKPQRA